MKARIEFDLSEDTEAFEDFLNSRRNSEVNSQIWERVFRPNFKHGYGKEIDDIVERCGTSYDEEGEEHYNGALLIEKLSEIYLDITREEEEKILLHKKNSKLHLALFVAGLTMMCGCAGAALYFWSISQKI